MQIHEKLKVMRQCKHWTQEDLAEKLGWTVNTYAKIERGEADIKLDKLNKLAEVFGVDMQELLNANEKTVFNFVENCSHSNHQNCTIVLSETQCAHELEKAQLLLREREKEIEYLKTENARLLEMMELLKRA
jgi:transcriptional regulator with XRE-family HTH domain